MICYALLPCIYKHCPVFFHRSWFVPEKDLGHIKSDQKLWKTHRISPFNLHEFVLRLPSVPVVDITLLTLFEARAMSMVCGPGTAAQELGHNGVLLVINVL